jgi:hypothetical protein
MHTWLSPHPLTRVSCLLSPTVTTESAGALPPPGASTATAGAGTGLAEALNLAGGAGGSGSSGGGVSSVERPAEDATDPELASWVEQLQQEVRDLL